MSSEPPTNTKPDKHGGSQLPALGARPLSLAIQQNPSTYQNLLPPSSSRSQPPHYSLPTHLDPPFVPDSPQARPLYSDSPARRHASHSQKPYGLASASEGTWPVPGSTGHGQQVNAVSLPRLYPPEAVRHAGVVETNYETISPVEHASHGRPGRSPFFDDSTYASRPYPAGSTPQFSPTDSHRSSTTSSSGRPPRAQLDAQTLASQLDHSFAPKDKEKEQNEFERYIFKVRQQPKVARACGFGERDRRVIDPPAVVQLSFKDYDPESPTDRDLLEYPLHVAHCSLFAIPGEPSEATSLSDVTSVPDPNKSNTLCRRLMGTLVASPFVGTDPEALPSKSKRARLGCFFLFSDLSVRQAGCYRLRFTLMKVPLNGMAHGGQGNIASIVDSDVFEVFAAGSFPGMSPSSRLIKGLKREGASVTLKRGKEPGKTSKRSGSPSEKSGSEASEEADTSSSQARQRRRRD